ncbi:hypothetical protein BRADI_1g61015v3 [Brachypodium distachyon]|uniref:Reverse transcriptase zinc-binding domain-containing protein n=1 Tax=Brachypodium distachyon TaxID=15368 RepID=A0A2K2DSR7_BRADI|nr:hypothetical protein BRADI_1g61015v3 [Brachypodium distachyon]
MQWRWHDFAYEEETIDHLLFVCVVARIVWFQILSGWNEVRWIPAQESTMASWWQNVQASRKDKKVIATSAALVCWSIWKHRNEVVFEKLKPKHQAIIWAIQLEGASGRADAEVPPVPHS